MEYTRLGKTGLTVSRLALGCMSYGDPRTPGAHPWALTDGDAEPFFRQAVELGITFWDTANSYSLTVFPAVPLVVLGRREAVAEGDGERVESGLPTDRPPGARRGGRAA